MLCVWLEGYNFSIQRHQWYPSSISPSLMLFPDKVVVGGVLCVWLERYRLCIQRHQEYPLPAYMSPYFIYFFNEDVIAEINFSWYTSYHPCILSFLDPIWFLNSEDDALHARKSYHWHPQRWLEEILLLRLVWQCTSPCDVGVSSVIRLCLTFRLSDLRVGSRLILDVWADWLVFTPMYA